MLRLGTLEISLSMLRQILKLPEGTEFLKVRQSWEQEQRGVFEVLVDSPKLHETTPGNTFPWINCTIHTEFCKQDEVTHIVRSEINP